ncbi:hypothetical protein TRVL_03745 [Trypanosoma vivax]|nr:hypothetical protein TRVL_03745 [Trypanosoma vivax]
MSTLLCKEASSGVEVLSRLAKSLSSVTLSPRTYYNSDLGVLTLSDSSLDENISVLRDIGRNISSAVQDLVSAVEMQLTDFFIHMKREDPRLMSLLEKRVIVPEGFRIEVQDDAGKEGSALSPLRESVTNLPLSTKIGRYIKTSTENPRLDRQATATALQTCLFVMMEALLSRVNGNRAAIYIRNTSDVRGLLCRVAHVNGNKELPSQICFPSSDVLVTVVKSGVAVNWNSGGTGRYLRTREAPSLLSAAAEETHRSICAQCCMIFPLMDFGCAVVTDKPQGELQNFSPHDEHHMWAFSSLCEKVLSRYPHKVFLETSWNPSLKLLRQSSLLPPIFAVRPMRKSKLKLPEGPELEFRLDMLPSVAKEQLVLRSDGDRPELVTDGKGEQRAVLHHNDVLKDVVTRLRSLESSWGDILEKLRAARDVIDRQKSDISKKGEEMDSLRVEVRQLRLLLATAGN